MNNFKVLSILVLLFFSACQFKNETLLSPSVLPSNPLESELSLQDNDALDFGLHWVSENNNVTPAFNLLTQEKNNLPNTLYDPSKPTIIYFHGWQKASFGSRESFYFKNSSLDIDVNTVAQWKQDGWNVGIFYWNQFADETEVKDAEAKIWSTEGPRQMRYRKPNGNYVESNFPYSIHEVAFYQLQQFLPFNTSNNIRFAGHSLGNQLATAIAYKFYKEQPISLKRLELLDPFWSKGGKSFLEDMNNDGNSDWVGERCRWYVKEMTNNSDVAVTWYSSSSIADLGVGDKNKEMEPLVALVWMRFWYLNALQIADKHVYIRHHYFYSKQFQAPIECTIRWFYRYTTGNVTASANTTDQRIREMMGDRYYWDQVEGRYTPTPEDDWFEVKSY